ncbi:hypothetical protein OOZ15_04445 [Galbibacter sp. EGI 63066]|uniref:hypothetical protein n=1 Tax=Galbibacter sp. EGI 63066 TaxID=2993559 RepID=UPI002249208A|nr:hypothetical protein [Galbibacter sp. EGI 63066]MCX2679182.1 hypothetical protein [Galbibacter sp. EGI 63066]
MKIILYKITLLFLCAPLLCPAYSPGWGGKYTKEKKINKEFSVNANALLKIDNSYGNLHITSWDENRTVIEVHIKTNSNSEEKAQKKLDEIDVQFQASSSMVSAKTIFEKSNWSSGWFSWFTNDNVSMEINYTIKVPVGNSVELDNDYGGIYLDEINGKATINCDYGRIEIGKLNASNNVLNFDYTSKSTIGYIKSGQIDADYSGYVIENAGDLLINADYTTSEIVNVKNIEYSCDYGSIKIGNATNIKGDGDYLSTRFGTVHGNLELDSDYGSIKIEELAADAKNVKIISDYTGIKIGYNSNYHFNFEIELSYAGLGGDIDFEYQISREKSTSKYYQGRYGGETTNKLYIDSDYGSVNFNKKP